MEIGITLNTAPFYLYRYVWGNFQPVFASSGNPKYLESCKPSYGRICDKLKTSFYVDDLILSEHNLEAAKSVCQQAYEIVKAANLILRKWNSNDKELRKTFPNDAVERKITLKVLGTKWCTISDKISVDLEEVLHDMQSLRGTKQNILKAMAKIYDPLGMLGPFTIRIKLLL